MNTISGVYKITNTITNDFYIGSSKNVKQRLAVHKCKSKWKRYPNNPMYLDMQKYGLDKFEFQVIEEAEPGQLKELEQQFIETLNPTYNNYNAKGLDIERKKESQKKASNKYNKSDKYKEYQKDYQKSDKYKESHIKASNKYNNQLCLYNEETLTLAALSRCFRRAGFDNPTAEAKKYLLKEENKQQ